MAHMRSQKKPTKRQKLKSRIHKGSNRNREAQPSAGSKNSLAHEKRMH